MSNVEEQEIIARIAKDLVDLGDYLDSLLRTQFSFNLQTVRLLSLI